MTRSGLGEGRRLGHFIPHLEAFTKKSMISSGGEQVASRAEVRSDDAVHLDEALGMPGGFEAPHSSLPLTRRLM